MRYSALVVEWLSTVMFALPFAISSSVLSRHVGSTLGYCWFSLTDCGSASTQRWINVSCLMGDVYNYLEGRGAIATACRAGSNTASYKHIMYLTKKLQTTIAISCSP